MQSNLEREISAARKRIQFFFPVPHRPRIMAKSWLHAIRFIRFYAKHYAKIEGRPMPIPAILLCPTASRWSIDFHWKDRISGKQYELLVNVPETKYADFYGDVMVNRIIVQKDKGRFVPEVLNKKLLSLIKNHER